MFEIVKDMNNAFGNPEGNPENINWLRVEKQTRNVLDEYEETLAAIRAQDLDKVRDGLCDILVFALGSFHFLGIDAVREVKIEVNASLEMSGLSPKLLDADTPLGLWEMAKRYNETSGVTYGNPRAVDWAELQIWLDHIKTGYHKAMASIAAKDRYLVRSYLAAIVVDALGGFYRLGIDADADMVSVINGVLTRFCKNEEELQTTVAKYQTLGVDFYIEGEFPRKCLKSAKDQKDINGDNLPMGKFLKSAFFKEPVFYPIG